MEMLKLLAFDTDDLAVLSAHIQDSVLKVGDIQWQPSQQRLLLSLRRLTSAAKNDENSDKPQRRLSVLHFNQVIEVESQNLRRDAPNAILNLLTLQFEPIQQPEGYLKILMSGGGQLRLRVECLEAQLSDLGSAWEAAARPDHQID